VVTQPSTIANAADHYDARAFTPSQHRVGIPNLAGRRQELKHGPVKWSIPIVEIKDVVKRFPVGDAEITILKGISFEVKTGEFVSIVGPSAMASLRCST